MESGRQRSSLPQQRDRSRVAAGTAPRAATFSLLNLQESLGNQGLLGLLASGRLQPKLAVNQPGDVYEQEADRVAQQVISSSPASPVVQRKCACGGAAGAGGECEECRKKKEDLVQRKTEGDSAPATAPPVVHEVLGSAGQPLDPAARAFLEPHFGRSFKDVRIHTDERAAEAAGSVNALAFTVGRDVVFGAGRYEPGTREGQRLLAHELTHVVQQRGMTSGVMRQSGKHEGDEPIGEVEESLPHQCADDAALDAEYDEWIQYDPKKEAEEAELVNRINKEIFGPINQERNQIAADSFENFKAKKKAFPTGILESGASPERKKLFDTLSYDWLHSATAEDKERQQKIGVTKPVGDLSATGKIVPHAFGEHSPPGTIWDYRGTRAQAIGARSDATRNHGTAAMNAGTEDTAWWKDTAWLSSRGAEAKIPGSEFDTTIAADIEGQDDVSGYAEFRSKDQRILVPQIGFGSKPSVDKRQVMCHEAPVERPGKKRKRRGGPTGQHVTSFSLRDLFHGGRRFFDKGTKPVITGKGEVLGHRSGPGKHVAWDFNKLPDDPDKRGKIDATMRETADKIMAAKRKSYENLKQYYLMRAAFIAKYRAYLK